MWYRKPKRATIKNSINPLVGMFELIPDPVWSTRHDSTDMTFEFLIRYGERLAAPYITHFKEQGKEDVPLTEEQLTYIMRVISNKYKESWTRKYAVLDASYGLVDNYLMKEKEEIDRDTLDTRINEIIRNNTESRDQLTELMEIVKRDEGNTNSRTGSDVVEGDLKSDSTVKTRADNTTKHKTEERDTQSFLNRVDIEDRELNKTVTGRGKDVAEVDDALSFEDRKDTTKSDRDTIITDREKGTSKNKDDNTTKGDNKDSVYGYNVDGGTPSTSTEGMNKIDNLSEGESTADRDNRVDETVEQDLTKTGRELTRRDSTLTKTSKDIEDDTGSVKNSKTGQEMLDRKSEGTTGEEIKNDVTNELKDRRDEKTTYGSTDTVKSTADNMTTNTNTNLEENTLDEKTSEEGKDIGNVKEVRTMERSGNIGVTTSTQLLQEHVNFWAFNFLDEVYKDVANELTLNVYEGGY